MADKNVFTEAWVSVLEDILDLILLLGSLVYIFLTHDIGWVLSDTTMASVGTTAAGARLIMRRVVRKIVEIRLASPSTKI